MAAKFSKNGDRLINAHRQHVGDRAVLVLHRQRLFVEPLAAANGADHIQVRQESSSRCGCTPCPWHSSQRPPLLLKLKRPALYPRCLCFARAGEDACGFRRTGRYMSPRCFVACGRSATGRPQRTCRSGSRRAGLYADPASRQSRSDLPLDGSGEGGVDQRAFPRSAYPSDARKRAQAESVPRHLFRLFVVTPSIVIDRVLETLRRSPAALECDSSPDKIFARDRAPNCFALRPASPCATISPPCIAGARPDVDQSTSAARIVASSCSTTITVLPCCCSSRSDAISRPLSRGCKPIDGSSST